MLFGRTALPIFEFGVRLEEEIALEGPVFADGLSAALFLSPILADGCNS